MIYSTDAPGEIQGRVIGYSRTAGQVSYIIELPSGEKATVLKYQARPKIQYSTTETSRLPTRWVTVTSRGHTVFNINDLVTKEEFDRENERVRKLRQSPATGEAWEEGKPRRLPQTTLPATRKELAAFMEIAEWFVKYRRPITVKEMRPLATKYFPTEKEFVEFLEYLKSPEGQKEFRQELRDAMRRHNISLPSEEEYVSSVRKLVAQAQGGEELAPLIHKEDKTWYLGEWWEQEYSTADAIVYRSADGKKRLYIYWDGTKEVKPRDEKLLPALKPFDPYKFADYVLRNNVFSDTDTFVYSGLTGTNPHGVPDYIWAESLARMRGEFIKTGDLYIVHTPGVERPPDMRAKPTWREPSGELSLKTIELLADTEGDPLRKFCCRQCGECAPEELLEEGRFPDRIAWLRSHYKAKHPGMWGKMETATIAEPEKVTPIDISGLEEAREIHRAWATVPDEKRIPGYPKYDRKWHERVVREKDFILEAIRENKNLDEALRLVNEYYEEHTVGLIRGVPEQTKWVTYYGDLIKQLEHRIQQLKAIPKAVTPEVSLVDRLTAEGQELVTKAERLQPTNPDVVKFKEYLKQAQEAKTSKAKLAALRGMESLEGKVRVVVGIQPSVAIPKAEVGMPAVIPSEPSPPNPKEELEFVCDSPEFLAYTIEDIGYREKLDTAFETAIARAKGG